ncbi:hypothetical protein BC826DRAFT_196631 [Russula brevipes]|nr:hypothetical protein BC826DRAFT_196631 [Russula brevipes]
MSFIGGSMDTFVPYIYVMACSASRVPLLLRAANALTLTWCSYTVSEQRFADRASATCPYLRVACFYSSRKLRRALHPRYQGNASLGSSRVVDAECHWRHELSAFTDRFSERYRFPRMVSNSWCCVQNTASDSCEVNVGWNMVYLYQCGK